MEINQDHDVLLISAIANTAYLNEYLKKRPLVIAALNLKTTIILQKRCGRHHSYFFQEGE